MKCFSSKIMWIMRQGDERYRQVICYWSGQKLNFDFLENGLGIVSSPNFCKIFQEKGFSCYIIQSDQISLIECHYFLRYYATCLIQWFISQIVTSQISKLTIFLIKLFSTWLKSEKVCIYKHIPGLF